MPSALRRSTRSSTLPALAPVSTICASRSIQPRTSVSAPRIPPWFRSQLSEGAAGTERERVEAARRGAGGPADTVMTRLFGTDGVRGRAGEYPLDHETV